MHIPFVVHRHIVPAASLPQCERSLIPHAKKSQSIWQLFDQKLGLNHLSLAVTAMKNRTTSNSAQTWVTKTFNQHSRYPGLFVGSRLLSARTARGPHARRPWSSSTANHYIAEKHEFAIFKAPLKWTLWRQLQQFLDQTILWQCVPLFMRWKASDPY